MTGASDIKRAATTCDITLVRSIVTNQRGQGNYFRGFAT